MDYRCSDGRCSFEVEHRADSAKVADLQLVDVALSTSLQFIGYTTVFDVEVLKQD